VGAGGRAGGRVGLLTCQREGELKVVGWRLIGIGEGFPNQRGGQRERGGSRVYIYIYIYIYITSSRLVFVEVGLVFASLHCKRDRFMWQKRPRMH